MANVNVQSPIPLKPVDIKEEDGRISVEADDSNVVKCEDSNFSTSVVTEENGCQLEGGRDNTFQLSCNVSHPLEIPEDLVDRVFAQGVYGDKESDAFFSKLSMRSCENLAILPSTSSVTEAEADSVVSDISKNSGIVEEVAENKQSILKSDCCPTENPEDSVERVFAQNGDNEKEWNAFFSKFNMQNCENIAVSPLNSVIEAGVETKDANITRKLVSYNLQNPSKHLAESDRDDKSFAKMKNFGNSEINGKRNCIQNSSRSEFIGISNKKFRKFEEPQSLSNIFYDAAIKLRHVSVVLKDLFPEKSVSSHGDKNKNLSRFSSFKTVLVNGKKSLRKGKNGRSKASLSSNKCRPSGTPEDSIDRLSVQNVDEEELDAFFSKFNMQDCENSATIPPASSGINTVGKVADPNITKELVIYNQQQFPEYSKGSGCENEKGRKCVEKNSCSTVDIRRPFSRIYYDSAIKLNYVTVVLKDLFPKNSIFGSFTDKNLKLSCFSDSGTVAVEKKADLLTKEDKRNENCHSSNRSHPMEIPEDLVDQVFAQNTVNEKELDAFFSKFNMQESETLAILPSSPVSETEVISSSISEGNLTEENKGNKIKSPGKKFHQLEIPDDLVDRVFARNTVREEELDAFFSKFYSQNRETLAILPSTSSADAAGSDLKVSKSRRLNGVTGEDRGGEVNVTKEKCQQRISEDLGVSAQDLVTEEELDAFFSKFNMQKFENLQQYSSRNSEKCDYDVKSRIKLEKSETTCETDGGKNYVKNINSCSSVGIESSINRSRRNSVNGPQVPSNIFYDSTIKLKPVSVVLKDLFPKKSRSHQQKSKLKKSSSDFKTVVVKKERDLVKENDSGHKRTPSSRCHLMEPQASMFTKVRTQNEVNEQALDIFFSKFNMQDSKNLAISPPIRPAVDLKEESEKVSISRESVNPNSQYLCKQSEKSRDDKSLVKSIKCEKTDCEDKSLIRVIKCEESDDEINEDREYLGSNFYDAVDVKPQISASSREYGNAHRLPSIAFQNSLVKLKHVSVVLEDLFPKNSTSSSHRHSETKPCFCVYCTGKVQVKSEPLSDSEARSSIKQNWSSHSLVKRVRTEDYFKCPLCPLKHKSSMFMKKHSSMCHGLYLCLDCSARFEHKRDLKKHERKHPPKKLYPCPECGKKYRDRLYWRRHQRTVHGSERRFSCAHCPAKFKCKNTLKSHIMWHHTNERPFSCAECPLRFKMKGALQKHIKIHTTDSMPYSCSQCSKKFRFSQNLNSHLKRHSSEKLFTCAKCAARFHSKKEVLHHLIVHTDERPYSCTKCPRKFKTAHDLKKHSVVHVQNRPRPFSCSLCSGTFKKKGDVQKHLQQVHFNAVLYPCQQCGAKLKSKKSLETHMVIHSDEKPYSCHLCPAKFKLKQCLQSHMIVHTEEKPFACTLCSAKFKEIEGLRTHSVVHSDEREFACSHCSLKFKTRAVLLAHIRRHFTDKNVQCPHCPAKFKDKMYLRYHMRKHSSEGKMYTCADCSATFWYKNTLRSHIVTHLDEKPFACSVCLFKCKWKSQLTSHMKTHAPKRQYECAHCSFRFADKSKLGLHMRRHTKEKPYSCSLCSYRCVDGSSLKAHQKVHSDERPHVCPHCHKTFKHKYYLKRHVKSHFDEKPFACGQCSRRFKHKDILLTHIRTHTGEKPFACKFCPAKFIQWHHLKSHSLLHTDEKPFSCTQCSAVFRHLASLKTHIESKHSDAEPKSCPHCPAKFGSTVGLKNHLKIHVIGNPYPCPHCPSKFKTRGNLSAHLKTHSDIQYECAHCLVKMKSRGGLKHHIGTHMNERLFPCTQCSKRYNSAGALYTHVRMIHRTVTQSPKLH